MKRALQRISIGFYRKRQSIYSLSIIVIIAAVLFVALHYINNQSVLTFVSVVANWATAFAVFLAVLAHNRERQASALEFFTQGDSEFVYNAKLKVYHYYKEKKESSSYFAGKMDADELIAMTEEYRSAFGIVCNFYESWGILVEKRYLPIDLFENGAGFAAVRLFFLLSPYIKGRQDDNPYFAANYEKLAKRINKLGISYNGGEIW